MEKSSLLKFNKILNVLKRQCKPSDTWQGFLDNDEEMGTFFTQEGINSVSCALDNFIDKLIDLEDYTNGKYVEESIHKLIVKLNEISHNYEGMIETNEREELVNFINSVLDTIEYQYIGDITEQWREW